ncbi:DUF1054 family protein [Leuconostocaceae bacterium ESL0723]|nr:DUF1054 family protein [Leuconostocaceae bacterium ESL0723]
MFKKADFKAFDEPTLDGRMKLIQTVIDPEFEDFAEKALPILKEDGQDWVAHVAKHRMRTTNPPENTWVAFAPNPRGYKMMPHFELGLWEDHLYFYLAVEANMKPKETATISKKLAEIAPLVAKLPDDFVISQDHMVNQTWDLNQYDDSVARYQKVKASEVLIGRQFYLDNPLMGTPELEQTLLETLKELIPLYEKLR